MGEEGGGEGRHWGMGGSCSSETLARRKSRMSYAGQLFAANDWASLWTRPSLGFDGSFQQGTAQRKWRE